MRTKMLKLFGYSSFFWTAFVLSLYFTFPVHRVKGVLVQKLEEGLGKGKQGAYGVDPKVTIDKVSLWRLSGLDLKRVSIQLGSRDPDPGPTIDLDRVQARLGLFSLLSDEKTVAFQGEAYAGSFGGEVSVDQKGNLLEADVDVEDVDLGQAPLVLGKLGVPATGKLSARADLDLGKEPEKSGKGEVKIEVQGITIGPGELKIPLPGLTGGLTLPLIDMGNLQGEILVENGKGKIEKLKLDGKHVSGEITGDLGVRSRFGSSKLDGNGWIKISESFLEENSKFKTLLEFPGPLQKARDDEGRYHFTLRGTLSSPNASLARDGGKRARSKAKAAPAEEKAATPG